MARLRTFVAVNLSSELVRRIRQLARDWSRYATGVRWVGEQQLHVTMKFLGDVDENEVYRVCQVVRESCHELSPFFATCASVGVFPHWQRPHTLWLGIGQGRETLIAWQADLERRFGDLGFPLERRGFTPHITLGRVERGRSGQLTPLADHLAQLSDQTWGDFPVQEAVVYASELSPRGPHYAVLGRLPLATR